MLRRLRGLSLGSKIAFGVVLALVLGAVPAWAYWSASRPVSSPTFTLGNLQVQVGSGASPASFAATTTAPLNASTLSPGASYAALVTVKNTGTVAASYWISVAGSGPLVGTSPNSLTTTVTQSATVTGAAPAAHCSTGTSLASGQTVTTTDTTLNNMSSAQAGRRQLVVPGSSTETVCIEVAMTATAPSTDQGQSANLVYTFNATQVKATP